jgi:tRNA (cytidine32/uridine32-2'-O)-methyltransferase
LVSELGSLLRERVRVVLVRPQHPGNVGSTARAMANMGLRRLVVVDPPGFDLERARWMASGGREVLENVRLVSSVAEAVADCDLAVGCSARNRRWDWPVLNPHQLASKLCDAPTDTAILFGREDMGLANEDLALCQVLLRIPTDGEPSLNLSQAVLVVANALFSETLQRGWRPTEIPRQGKRSGGGPLPQRPPQARTTAPLDSQQRLVQETVATLHKTSYMLSRPDEKVAVTLGALLQRAQPTDKEIAILRGMGKKIRHTLDHPGEE